MQFRWNEWNSDHIESHGVDPEEAEVVVDVLEAHIRSAALTVSTSSGVLVGEIGSFKSFLCWTTTGRYS